MRLSASVLSATWSFSALESLRFPKLLEGKHDFEPLLRPYLLSRLAVHADHGLVFPADDQKRRS